MRKSKDVSFPKIGKITEEYESSGPSDAEDISDSEDKYQNQQSFQSQDFIVDLFPSIEQHKINMKPAEDQDTKYKIFDKEYNLDTYSVYDRFEQELHIEPISLVILQYVNIDKFLEGIHEKSQLVLGWKNVKNASTSDYATIMQNYAKTSYASIRARIKQSFYFAPTVEKLSQLNNVRNDQMCNRILYHYNGFGLPEINEQYMWCSAARAMEFAQYKLSDLFSSIRPPSAFIFDCNNSEAVISTFHKTAEKNALSRSSEADWNDWFCFCSTSKGEKMPADQILPKDIFTNFLLNPLRSLTMFIILKYFRKNFCIENFPAEMPFSNLWDETNQDAKNLKEFLIAIVDALACDGIESSLYTKLFRTDNTVATLYRNFLVAQHYLAIERIHPRCYPDLPDLSLHPLWEQFDHVVISAIARGDVPVKILVNEFYSRLTNSFSVYLKNMFIDMIKPYHLVLLYQMIMKTENDTRPTELLAKYASLNIASHEALINASFFPVLISRLGKADIHSRYFHVTAFLVLSLLFYNPKFEGAIRHEDDISKLTSAIFDKTIDQETRTIVTAIVSFLVISYEKFLRTCNEYDFLEKLANELKICSAEHAFWLMMLAKRTFGLYSPSPATFVNTGLHIQVAAFLMHKDPMLRNAALSVLSAFVQPFESAVNGQLLFMCLHLIDDTCIFTRFHLLQMIKKYILGFSDLPLELIGKEHKIPNSYTEILEMMYKNPDFVQNRNMETVFKCTDSFVRQKEFMNESFEICYKLIEFYSRDPHPAISNLAQLIISYLVTRSTADESEVPDQYIVEQTDDYFEPPDIVAYGDDVEGELLQLGMKQNEALFFTALRNLLQNGKWILEDAKGSGPGSSTWTHIRTLSYGSSEFKWVRANSYNAFSNGEKSQITCASFTKDNSVIAGTENGLIYSNEKGIRSEILLEKQVTSLTVSEINLKENCFITTSDGCVFIWQPDKSSPSLSFKATPAQDEVSNVLLCVSSDAKYVYTVGSNDIVCCWNIEEERLEFEKVIGAMYQPSSLLLDVTKNTSFIIGYQNGIVREITAPEEGKECIPNDLQLLGEKEPITKLDYSFEETKLIYYALTESGNFFSWDKLVNVKQLPIKKQKYTSFAVHKTWPIIIFSPANETPFATDLEGKVIGSFGGVSPDSFCIAHMTQPFVGFVSKTGDVSIFKLVNT